MASDVIFKIHEFNNDISWEKDSAIRDIDKRDLEVSSYDVWNETPFDVSWASNHPLPRGHSGGNLGPINRPHSGKIHKLSDGDGDSNHPIPTTTVTLRFTNQATGTTLRLSLLTRLDTH